MRIKVEIAYLTVFLAELHHWKHNAWTEKKWIILRGSFHHCYRKTESPFMQNQLSKSSEWFLTPTGDKCLILVDNIWGEYCFNQIIIHTYARFMTKKKKHCEIRRMRCGQAANIISSLLTDFLASLEGIKWGDTGAILLLQPASVHSVYLQLSWRWILAHVALLYLLPTCLLAGQMI